MDCEDARISNLLRGHGLRPTKTRCLILALLVEKNHLSAAELAVALRARLHRFGTATVYQSLTKMADAGLLVRFIGIDGLVRFDANLLPHHHLICVRCHRVVDVHVSLTDAFFRMIKPVCRDTGKDLRKWRIEGGQVELKGVCPMCAQPA